MKAVVATLKEKVAEIEIGKLSHNHSSPQSSASPPDTHTGAQTPEVALAESDASDELLGNPGAAVSDESICPSDEFIPDDTRNLNWRAPTTQLI